jgi:sensor histidine kinase regulating citrate/malate metabolism
MFLQREEVLDGLAEGILLVNSDGECEYANEAAGNLFGSRELQLIQPFVDIYAGESVRSNKTVLQETIRYRDHTLLMDILPVWNGSVYVGSLVEINDKSDSVKMAAQLTGVDQIIGALRASTHETKNRMHVILGLLQIGEVDEAIDFIQSAAGYDAESDHIRELIRNNTLAALLIGKRSRAKELGVDLRVRKDSFLGEKSRFLSSAELVTIVGNLLENALDAIIEKGEKSGSVILYISENEDMLVISVDDTGCGMNQEQIDLLMQGGYTTKGDNHGIGMGLIRNIIKGFDGDIDIESEPGEGTSINITIKDKKRGIK